MIKESLVLGGLGLAFGLGLAYLSKRFYVKRDSKIDEVSKLLPGINCGSCGYAGCDAFAEAIVEEDADISLCAPGSSNHEKIAKVIGKEISSTDKKIAIFKCHGNKKTAKDKYDYKGVKSCSAASQVAGGPKLCSYGCIGLGDCVNICPVNAITLDKNNLPVVNEDLCIACGKCVKECPKNLFQLLSQKNTVYVKCNSKDVGKKVTQSCTVGCIACRLCEKSCKFDAIHVIDNLAVIDYEKCKNCGLCATACPRHIIINKRVAKTQEEQKKYNLEFKKKQKERLSKTENNNN